jgi:hypothetical protein
MYAHSVGSRSSSCSSGTGNIERKRLGRLLRWPNLQFWCCRSCSCRCSCYRLRNHRLAGGDVRPSQGECCKCCIGNNRYATGFQLREVSDTEQRETIAFLRLTKLKRFPFFESLPDLLVRSCHVTSHCTYLSTTFARIRLLLLVRRLRMGALVIHRIIFPLSRTEKSTVGVHRRCSGTSTAQDTAV